jgi:hypothetical protein
MMLPTIDLCQTTDAADGQLIIGAGQPGDEHAVDSE